MKLHRSEVRKAFGALSSFRRTRIALAPLALASVTIAACGGNGAPRLLYDHEFALSPGNEHVADLSSALLAPIDATNPEPIRGLEVANEEIATLIVDYLASKGVRVERIDARAFQVASATTYRDLLAERGSGRSEIASAELDLSDGIPQILEKLDAQPDLVIVADVVMRRGRWNGGSTLVWDGVRRRDRTAGHGATTGTSSAASLFVTIHKRDGTRVFSGYGGLDLIFEFNLSEARMEIREELLQDERKLAEGVCVAFYPYFGARESCYR